MRGNTMNEEMEVEMEYNRMFQCFRHNISLAFRPHLAPSLNALLSFCMLFIILSGGGQGGLLNARLTSLSQCV